MREYKIRKNQIFGKTLPVPDEILNKVYTKTLTIEEVIEYDLIDKIDVNCLNYRYRNIAKKFGMDCISVLDWDFILKNQYWIETEMEHWNVSGNIMDFIYEQAKNAIVAGDYHFHDYLENVNDSFMERYPQLFLPSDFPKDIQDKFYHREFYLKDVYSYLDKLKDISFKQALHVYSPVREEQIITFFHKYPSLVPFLVLLDDAFLLSLLETYDIHMDADSEKEYMKDFLMQVLLYESEQKGIIDNAFLKECFQYLPVSMFSQDEHFLHFSEKHGIDKVIDSGIDIFDFDRFYSFQEISKFYSIFEDYGFLRFGVASFFETYGLSYIKQFDKDSKGFLSRSNYKNAELLWEHFLKYESTDIEEIIDFQVDSYDAFVLLMYYSFIYMNKQVLRYDSIQGKFRKEHGDIFLDKDASNELKEAYYTGELVPSDMMKHPDWVPFLKKKNLVTGFKEGYIQFPFHQSSKRDNIYHYLEKNFGNEEALNLFSHYGTYLDYLFLYEDGHVFQLHSNLVVDIEHGIYQGIMNRVFEISDTLPRSFQDKYPKLFLGEDAPMELKKAFYGRKLVPSLLKGHPDWFHYLVSKDLKFAFVQSYYKVIDLIGLSGFIRLIQVYPVKLPDIGEEDALEWFLHLITYSNSNEVKKTVLLDNGLLKFLISHPRLFQAILKSFDKELLISPIMIERPKENITLLLQGNEKLNLFGELGKKAIFQFVEWNKGAITPQLFLLCLNHYESSYLKLESFINNYFRHYFSHEKEEFFKNLYALAEKEKKTHFDYEELLFYLRILNLHRNSKIMALMKFILKELKDYFSAADVDERMFEYMVNKIVKGEKSVLNYTYVNSKKALLYCLGIDDVYSEGVSKVASGLTREALTKTNGKEVRLILNGLERLGFTSYDLIYFGQAFYQKFGYEGMYGNVKAVGKAILDDAYGKIKKDIILFILKDIDLAETKFQTIDNMSYPILNQEWIDSKLQEISKS